MRLLFFLVSCVISATGCAGGEVEDTGNGGPVVEVAVDKLTARAAAEICTRLDECCASEDYDWYLGAYLSDERNMDLVAQLGDEPEWTLETCTSFLKPAMENTWVGSWLSAMDEGLVGYRAESVGECIESLREADCGESLRNTLLDPQCFGYYPPSGGEEHRLIFERSAAAGESCAPIADGFGGLYYGSCNPEEAFCCVDTEYGCQPFPTEEDRGTCVTASKVGEACSSMPIQLCVTGAECIEDVCTEVSYDELQLGETCYNTEKYELLGYCKDSWCDMFGSAACEPLQQPGETCEADWECSTNWCDVSSAVCVENRVCALDD